MSRFPLHSNSIALLDEKLKILHVASQLIRWWYPMTSFEGTNEYVKCQWTVSSLSLSLSLTNKSIIFHSYPASWNNKHARRLPNTERVRRAKEMKIGKNCLSQDNNISRNSIEFSIQRRKRNEKCESSGNWHGIFHFGERFKESFRHCLHVLIINNLSYILSLSVVNVISSFSLELEFVHFDSIHVVDK